MGRAEPSVSRAECKNRHALFSTNYSSRFFSTIKHAVASALLHPVVLKSIGDFNEAGLAIRDEISVEQCGGITKDA